MAKVWLCLLHFRHLAAQNITVKGPGPPRHFVAATQLHASEEVRTKFRLLSWNILAPSWDNQGVKKSNWEQRMPRILQEIRLRKPDVMVLQEVEVLIYDDQLQPFLKSRGFQSIFTGVDSGIGVAVFWRSTKFELGTATDFDLTTTTLTPWRASLDEDFNAQQRSRYLRRKRLEMPPEGCNEPYMAE